jgi:hypothetical protein
VDRIRARGGRVYHDIAEIPDGSFPKDGSK